MKNTKVETKCPEMEMEMVSLSAFGRPSLAGQQHAYALPKNSPPTLPSCKPLYSLILENILAPTPSHDTPLNLRSTHIERVKSAPF